MNMQAPFSSRAEEITSALITKLSLYGILYKDTSYDPARFQQLKRSLVGKISLPGTTITPMMERMLFATTSSECVKNVAVLGSYYGYGLLWLAGGLRRPEFSKTVGFDIDKAACAGARQNLNAIGFEWAEVRLEDAFSGVRNFADRSLDVLFIDVEKDGSKSDYAPLLETWYSKLKPEALVLAHDPLVEKFEKDFRLYSELVNDPRLFSVSITLKIDPMGLMISKKVAEDKL